MRPSFSDPNSADSLQKRYNDLTAQINRGTGAGGMTSQYQHLLDEQRALQGQMSARASSAGAGGETPEQKQAKTRQQILDYTAGRGDSVMNDAMTNAALARLDKVSSGADAPFTLAVQNQQLAQQAGMNATSAGSQAEMLRMQAAGLGGSIADPSYQARLRQIESQRQSSNADAQGQIQTNAQLQNFGARQTGTNSLLSGRTGQMGMANSQYNQAADFLRNDSQTGQHQSMVQQPFMYNFSQNSQPSVGNYQTPPIQYQQNNTAQAPAGGASAGIMQGQQPAAQQPQAPTPQIMPVMHTNTGGYQYPQSPQPYQPQVQLAKLNPIYKF